MAGSGARVLHRLTGRAAAEFPARAAVITPDRTVSHAELDGLADGVAGELRAAAAGQPLRDTLVAVVMHKGWEQVAALLGILKAGAAYLPIDPTVPAGRLARIIELAGCTRAVTQAALLDTLDWPAGLALSTVEHPTGGAPADPAAVAAAAGGPAAGPAGEAAAGGPGDLAYVMFTSGSTGTPKGVMIEHGGVVDTVGEMNRRFAVGPGDRAIGLSALTFDLSVYELFGPLVAGGAVVLPAPDRLRDPAHWAALMREHRVTIWHGVPTLMELMVSHLEETGARAPEDLRLVVLSGDWIPLDLPDRVRRHFPGARVVSMGGSTETSVYSLIHEVDRVDPAWASIPYGTPLPGEGCLVLDEELRPVPVGTPGDMYITGTGLARGYWRDPRRTAESFLHDPATGVRMYRTGDRGRIMPDGQVEFLGRQDLQVKIRGYRIELGEIEAAALSHPDVQRATVVATGPRTALNRLTAFVVPVPGATVEPDALLAFLAGRLPGYLVPQAVRVAAELPLTGNGKVDRAELARLAELAPTAPADPADAPRTGTERRVADLLADLLDRPVDSRTRTIFELGGNSLVGTQLVTRLRAVYGPDVPAGLALTHPTVAAMASALDALPAGRRGAEPALGRRDPGSGEAPLSFGQEQVWFLDQLAGGNRAYHFQCAVRFAGTLRPELIQRALTEVVRRHEILRTTFHDWLDGPVQVVHEPAPVPLPQVDLRSLPEAAREDALRRELRAEHARTFDLQTGPLIGWKLIRVADADWVLTETEHHLIHDGWSVAVLWREISALYQAWAAGAEPDLPEPPVQFGDYADWQRRRYLAGRRAELLPYWKRRLAGSAPFDLAVAGPRPAKQTFNGDALRVTVPAELYAALRSYAAAEGVSLFVLMFAVFNLLMRRYSGERDLTVGTWLANRDRAETEHLIGMLVNMVALRTEVTGAESFRDLNDQIRRHVVDALAHADAPFQDVVTELALPRDPSRNPLVQTCFSFHDSPVPDFRWPGADGAMTEYNNGTAKFDLNVVVIPRAEQLRAGGPADRGVPLTLMWEYNTDLITHEAAARMVDHFHALLAAAIAAPDRPTDALPMITDADRAAIAAANRTVTPAGPTPADGVDHLTDGVGLTADDVDVTVVGLVERQVAASPDAVAVRAVDGTLTYRELWDRAGALASALVARGTKPGDRVAVCVRRSLHLPVALLGACLAGAAYVPIDPHHPPARRDFVLTDSAAGTVLTETALAGEFGGHPVMCVDALPRRAASGQGAPVGPDDEAYLVYTSGSTGRPKGVRIPHRALANLLLAMRDQIGFTARDTLVAVTTMTFDIAALEQFLPLVCGGTVVIATSGADGAALADLLTDSAATVLQATPMTWRMLVDVGWRATGRFTALCGGERLPADLAAELAARADVCWNVYGPTETTIWSTAYRVRGGEPTVPIGRPLRNTEVQVLDAAGAPCAVGLPGELYIGGTGLALGYTDPALTAAAFVEVPEPGRSRRRYRTGDLVRLRADGELEFIRRLDRQVKLHGYRIEPGEIEQALRTHPGVADCAVVLRDDPPRLVAYVVPAPGGVSAGVESAEELHRHLAGRLPAYLVPRDYLSVPGLPRTPNGKLDPAALPAPSTRRPTAAGPADRAGPLVGIEAQLAAVWAEVLGQDRIGPEDDFFVLGGHSLLALRLVSRIRSELHRSTSVDLVFDHPTVREMAVALAAEGGVRRSADG